MSKLDDYLTSHATQFEDELCDLLRIPSISADSKNREDIRRAAKWVEKALAGVGCKTEIFETPGHPIVFGETPAQPGRPTILVYGHYDVQPVDPLNEWTTPPFEPARRDGNLYARGSTDDKGQVLTHVFSTRAWKEVEGGVPLNLKFLIEGEEEIGSRNLDDFIDTHGKRLSCDVAVISDTSQFGPGKPAITYGLKGIAYYELFLTGAKQDLHSGTFGGAVSNPANALTKMLAALRDDQGRVLVPGFYDDVLPLTDKERKAWADLAFDEKEFKEQIGIDDVFGETGYSTLERKWGRPTFDINGLTSGYQGEGAKTVLPATASAKFSFRLVAKQDPSKIHTALEKYLRQIRPPGIKMKLEGTHNAPGVLVPTDSPYVQAAARAIDRGFGKPPVFIREGGSIPIVSTFREKLGVDTLLLGWGLSDDNAHGPNEKFCLADFHRGIKSSTCLWEELAKLPPAKK